jgi:hypothetical protein
MTMRFAVIVGVLMFGAMGCASGAADDNGVSAADLAACPRTYQPVCGVNGHTYTNSCTAHRHAIAYLGECQPECAGLVCAANETCNPTTGSCVNADPCAGVHCITGAHCSVVNGVGQCGSVCDGVRCPSGQMCVAVGNAVSCQPATCPPERVLCMVGYHWDNTPGVCSCVQNPPAACPPNTLLCMVGYHYDGTPGVCHCVANAPAACPPERVLCIRGDHYDNTPGVCGCVPDTQCSTDADCQLVDDYCGGCACDALTIWQSPSSCTNPVQCFREPCGGLTAHCVSGTCVGH